MKSSVNLLCIFGMRLCTFLKILSAVLSLSLLTLSAVSAPALGPSTVLGTEVASPSR